MPFQTLSAPDVQHLLPLDGVAVEVLEKEAPDRVEICQEKEVEALVVAQVRQHVVLHAPGLVSIVVLLPLPTPLLGRECGIKELLPQCLWCRLASGGDL